MDKAALLAGLGPKPVRFEINGFPVNLRPLSVRERLDLREWQKGLEGQENAGLAVLRRLVSLCLCDETGASAITEDETDALDVPTLQALGKKAAQISGLIEADPGKAEGPGTQS